MEKEIKKLINKFESDPLFTKEERESILQTIKDPLEWIEKERGKRLADANIEKAVATGKLNPDNLPHNVRKRMGFQ
jgi:hypothetical protein